MGRRVRKEQRGSTPHRCARATQLIFVHPQTRLPLRDKTQSSRQSSSRTHEQNTMELGETGTGRDWNWKRLELRGPRPTGRIT